MTFENGGISDKQGNAYENRYLARVLIRLLAEEITSVVVEPVGKYTDVCEFYITEKDGIIDRDLRERNWRRHDDAGGVYGLPRNGAQDGGRHQYLHYDLHGSDRLREPYLDSSSYIDGEVGCDAAVHRRGHGGEPMLGQVCQPGE